jgi:hypothetical protein
MTRKSSGYFHEANATMMSSNIPSGITFFLSSNSKVVGVGLRRGFNYNSSKVVITIKFMASPRSMRVFSMETLLMVIVTMGFPRFPYFVTLGFSNMYLESSPIICTVGGSLCFLPVFLIHNSLTTLL